MRLISLKTLKLQEFFGQQIPKYAILSHRWEAEEVTHQDFISEGNGKGLAGFAKLKSACEQAARDGHEYLWIDTCCIDKTSSAELSEAINSMFAWYERAEVCYAYLSDVPSKLSSKEYLLEGSAFRKSLWFKRGWTLQELLAPEDLRFFDSHWQFIGNKTDYPVRTVLSTATGIKDFKHFRRASVAQKMSWLSERTTTRVEDMAYCMLGILGVHMPPLYGEEENAFQRLQLEVLDISDDESIFAWKSSTMDAKQQPERGMLATSAQEFRDAGDIVRYYPQARTRSLHFSMTNKGLLTHMTRQPFTWNETSCPSCRPVYTMTLQCGRLGSTGRIRIYLALKDDAVDATRVFPDIHAHEDSSAVMYTMQRRLRGNPVTNNDVALADPIYIKGPPVPTLARELWDEGLDVRLSIKDARLKSRLMDIIIQHQHISCWIEEKPYRFRIRLDGSWPVGILLSNLDVKLLEGPSWSILLLHKARGVLMTTVDTVSKEAVEEKSRSTILQQVARHKGVVPNEAPQDPTQSWTAGAWSVPVYRVNGRLCFAVFERNGAWHCVLSMNDEQES